MAEIIPFQYPSNAMINFQPLDSALKDYQTGMQVAGESQAKINAANAMAKGDFTGAAAELAKVDPRAAMELQKQPGVLEAQKMTNEETTRKLVGGTMEALAAIPDPTLRAQAAQKIFSTDPRWAAGAAKFGYDINNPAHIDSIIAAGREEALGPQNPEARALTQARTAQALTEKVGPAESLVRIPTAGTPGAAATPAPGSTGTAAAPPAGATTLFKGGTTLQTQEEREAAWDRWGLPKGTQQYAEFMSTGKMPTRDLPPEQAKIVDRNQNQSQALDIVAGKLRDAKNYSRDAFQGFTADFRAGIINATPWLPWTAGAQGGASATKQMDVLTMGQALGQAKNDAGSRVTAYLEKLEQRLRAEPNMPDALRQKVIDEAIKYVEQNKAFIDDQTKSIINRTNFKPPGAPPATAGTPPPGRVPTAEINDAYARARDAIAKGADPAAVAKRLRDAGIDPSGL